MRHFREPTCRNFLLRPLVLGVPTPALLLLSVTLALLVVAMPRNSAGDLVILGLGGFGYLLLRILSRFSKIGFEEAPLFLIEQLVAFAKKTRSSKVSISFEPYSVRLTSPDTADEAELLLAKGELEESFGALGRGCRLQLFSSVTGEGLQVSTFKINEAQTIPLKAKLEDIFTDEIAGHSHVYSLYALPAVTDPLWLFHCLKAEKAPFRAVLIVEGLDARAVKTRLEGVRKLSSRTERLSSVDEEVAFEDSSRVLAGLVRGEERLVEISLIITSEKPLSGLDEAYFHKEKNVILALASAYGVRARMHRALTTRLPTAADLALTVFDFKEEGLVPTLQTRRGYPVYFDPADVRLEAPHWLVAGASGTGKSFFTGLILKRLIEEGRALSVLFIDHNRSFRRAVLANGGKYMEPTELGGFEPNVLEILSTLSRPGRMAGVELSELTIKDRRAAVGVLLTRIESYLRNRPSHFPVYIVFDECWAILREDPERIQRAFREYRKLGGAAIAVTQSLSDFLRDDSGESIFQNAATRILLRQGEDMGPHRSRLSLNDREINELRYLRQVKGRYSECLIKTPFSSVVARLYPTPFEHDLLRTDNLRREVAAAEIGNGRHA